MQPQNRGRKYIDRKFKMCQLDKKVLFLCIQSLDLASKLNQKIVIEKLNILLETNDDL